MNFFEHECTTHKSQSMTKITNKIVEDIKSSGILNGIVVVSCPHTTAGLTINENADPDVVHDMLYGFEKVFPTKDSRYQHLEGNSHAHMKSTVFGASLSLILADGKLVLGIWQDIYFCDFDGPRHRKFFVKILEG